MKNIISTFVFSLWLITGISNAQDITNTLAPNGNFIIKDVSADYLSLSQSTGFLSLNHSLVLPNTTSPSLGVIFKGADRFIHNFGTDNIFIGINSGNFNMTGVFNTTLGELSLNSNTTGSYNTAFGFYSLKNNTTGGENTAMGWSSLASNTTGYNNTTVGYNSLYYNTTGFYNTSVGVQSLYSNTTGYNNTAVGWSSLNYNTTGYENVAVGYTCLTFNTTGYNNTAVGPWAGANINSGSNLTCLGNNAQPTSSDATNQITLGNLNVSSLRCNATTITSLSDARDKKNITDLTLGLDFITKLKPRQFNWDRREWYEGNKSDGSKMKEEPTAGFIAQELDEAQTTENAEWLNLVLKDNPEKWEATPGNLLPIMVKAIQELAIKNEKLEIEKDEEIAELRIKNKQLKIGNNDAVAKLTEENIKLNVKNQNLEERLAKFEEMQTVLVKKMEQIESNEQFFKVQIVNSENNNQ